MPIYEYRCSVCGRQVEIRLGIHDQGPDVCASCGGAMRKALSTPAILFKGSGWAKKDARSASGTSKPADGAKEAGSGAKEPSTGGSSESKSGSGASVDEGKPATTVKSD